MSSYAHGSFAGLEADQPFDGVTRRYVSSDHSTLTLYAFAPGAQFPVHRHPSEQLTVILDGEVELTVDGSVEELAAGSWSVIPGGIAHGICAGGNGARLIAIVTPRRERQDEYELVGAG
jgi:quercetin dioxygenase-like cupin family protein